MTTLTATAVITAVDRASAVFARVGAAAHAIGGRFGAAAGKVSRFGQAAALNLGMPAAMAGAYAASGEYEVDRLSRLMQSAGELNEQQRKLVVDSAFNASMKAGIQAQDMIRGLREVILGGFGAEEAAAAAEFLAKTAKANGTTVDKVAEDGIKMSGALGLAMDTATDRTNSMRKALEFVSVVQAKSPESWEGLTTAMKYAAPVATTLKIGIGELGAALSMLSFAGFKGEESGTALRTIMTRMVAPTKAAREQLRAAGVQLDEIANVDYSKLGNMGSLKERLLGAGLGQEIDLDSILGGFADPTKFEGIYEWNDALMTGLMKAMGISKGDSQSRSILQKAIQNHVFNSVSGVDLERYFQGIKDMTPAAMRDLFGLQRISQAESLRKKLQEIVELPDGQRISAFRSLADEIVRLMPGAIDRRSQPVLEGFSASLDRIGAALGTMRHAIFESGVGAGLADVFESLASSLKKLSQVDPSVLRAIGYGLAGLTVAPIAGFAIAGIASGLGALAAVVGGPALAGLIAAGGLAAVFGDLGGLFQGGYFEKLGASGGILTGFGEAPMMGLARSIGALGSELAGVFGGALSAVQSLYHSLQGLLGFDVGGSPLVAGLNALSSVIQGIADTIRAVRESLSFDGMTPKVDFKAPEWMSGFAGTVGGPKPNSWLRNKLFGSEGKPMMNAEPGQGPGLREGALDVRTHVTGQATVKSDVTVRFEGLEGFRAAVSAIRNGTATIPLNTGQAMPDAGNSGGQQ